MMPGETTRPGLYIHIPFCKARCAYCDFFSTTDMSLVDAFIHALLIEIEAYGEEYRGFDTVYLGGGTPSLLPLHLLEKLLLRLYDVFTIHPGTEITVEINPADWGRSELAMARDLGVNRISIGIQSFDDADLSLLGRRHNAGQAMRTLEDARAAGYENLSLDLIYGIPGRLFHQWQASLEQALAFRPAHISCYELEIKQGTPLGERYGRGEFSAPPEEAGREFFMRTSEYLEEAGYTHYEVSNYAMTMDMASRHNRKYWDHTAYLGLGPSAHSYEHAKRWWNHASVSDYVLHCTRGIRPVAGSEDLTIEQMRLEALFLGLRTRQGIDLAQYRERYGRDLLADKGPVLDALRKAGLLEVTSGSVRPTRAGMAVADSLVVLA